MVASTILHTKLYFPPVRASLVPRPHLVDRLQTGLRGPLTLISAPAGYGKTTLLSEWRSGLGSGMPAAWLSLDAENNDISRFLMYLASALSTLKAEIGESVLVMIQSPQPPPTHVILTALIHDLVRALATPYALVLDDYHVITVQPVHDAVNFLLDNLPPQMHLVILTRADPPLSLARLRARNQLTEIRAHDLRFTMDESAAFLSQTMGLSLSQEQVASLEARTEGWIAGLQLAALSMQGRDDVQVFISALSGSHRYIVDYLAEEVLNRQSETVREFLLRTSILDRLSAPLCNVLTDRTDGQETLENLEHANLFVIPLDDERCWYRYHHLFADTLQNHLQQKYPDRIVEFLRCAAEWCEQNGFISEAINYSLTCGDIDRAAALIEQNAWLIFERGEMVTLAGWLTAVQPLMQLRPWLCIYHAWERVLTGNLDAAQTCLLEVEQIINARSDVDQNQIREMQGHIASIRAYAMAIQRDTSHVIALANQALELLPERSLSVRGIATWVLGAAYLLNGDIQRGKAVLIESARAGKETGNLQVAASAMRALAYVEVVSGRLYEAAEMFQEAIRLASGKGGKPFPAAAELFIGMGNLEYEWNHLDLAARYLEESVELSQVLGAADAMVGSRISLARLYQARGDYESARKQLSEAENIGKQLFFAPTYYAMLTARRIWNCLEHGDISRAAQIAADAGLDKDSTGDWLLESAYLAFARLLLAQGEVDQALALLERKRQDAEATERWGHVIEALIIKALCLQATGDQIRALNELERALALAEPRGYLRVFLDEGAPMINLLRHAGTGGIYPAYVKKLLSQVITAEEKTKITQPLIEPLSERELEILRLVADGKSNQQIADTLIIAVGTVKKHLNNIFGKLGVESRTQCIARARELNLLK